MEKVLFVSINSATIPVPFPISSTTNLISKVSDIELGITNVIWEEIEPSIGISALVVVVCNN